MVHQTNGLKNVCFRKPVEMLLDDSERFPEKLTGAGVVVEDRHSRVPEQNFQNKNVALHRAKKRWHSVRAS
jgi:hypothetical protein